MKHSVSIWGGLRHAGDWRYGTEAANGNRCPWSPTMQLFRQDESRRWEPVFEQVAGALCEAAILSHLVLHRAKRISSTHVDWYQFGCDGIAPYVEPQCGRPTR